MADTTALTESQLRHVDVYRNAAKPVTYDSLKATEENQEGSWRHVDEYRDAKAHDEA